MNKILISILVMCGIVGCKLPEQPELTPLESDFISRLEKKCKCKVYREINPAATTKSADYEKGWYLLLFEDLPCNVTKNRDSLNSISLAYAKVLHNKVLKDFGYKYDEISFVYDCQIGKDTYKSQVFDFKKSELE